jgi:CRISPR-associated protein Csm5
MKDVKWTAHIELLSPLHIGTGTDLLEGVDWIQRDGYVYVADQEALLEAVFDRAGEEGRSDAMIAQAIAGMTLNDLVDAGYLTPEDFSGDSPLFRYRLRGRPAMNQISEQIKDVYGQPYLPGSSLKGALRTVLAVGGATVSDLNVKNMAIAELDKIEERRRRGKRARPNRSWAGQPIEQELFAPGAPRDRRGRKRDAPHYDFLRALQVSDSGSVSSDHLSLMQVNIYPTTGQQTQYGQQRGLDIDVEALRQGTTFQVPIKVEGYLFSRQAEQKLRFGKRRNWLLNLPEWARRIAGPRMAHEIEFFQQRAAGRVVLGFYSRLVQTLQGLDDNEFLLQVGWGGGWLSKTFGWLLQEDAPAFERLVKDYRMTMERGRKAGDPFPRSRHLVRGGEHPAVPLGWMKVSLEGPQVWAEEEVVEEPAAAPVVSRPEDLQEGMVLEGTVRNVVKFGAFVDIGVGSDGLVHISELTEGYVRRVEDVVQVGQRVRVRVLNVERRGDRWRIGLTMKGVQQGTD